MLNQEAICSHLDRVGLKPYQVDVLKDKACYLRKKILSAQFHRRKGDHNPKAGDILAIPTPFAPITIENWESVPEGTSILSCAFAGTNWTTTKVKKTSAIEPDVSTELTIKHIDKEKRSLTFDQMTDLMVDEIVKANEADPTALADKAVAISLGFPFENDVLKNKNVDARFLAGKLTKFWEISDFATNGNNLIGQVIINKLKTREINVKHILIQNDTNSVGHNVISKRRRLPSGFVFGTGDNANLHQYNLEVGGSIIDEPDAIHQELIRRKFVPGEKNIIEYIMGGDFIKARVLAGLGLLNIDLLSLEKSVIENFISQAWKKDSGVLISLITGKNSSLEDFNAQLETNINEQTYAVFIECATRALQQAGQMIGIVIAAVAMASKMDLKREEIDAYIEGAVFWKGFGVKKTAKKTIDEIVENQIEFVEASGLIGVAQLGLVHFFGKK